MKFDLNAKVWHFKVFKITLHVFWLFFLIGKVSPFFAYDADFFLSYFSVVMFVSSLFKKFFDTC